jgi:hypothetical protein
MLSGRATHSPPVASGLSMATVTMATPVGMSNGTMLDNGMWSLPSLSAIPDLLDCHRSVVTPTLASTDTLSGMTSFRYVDTGRLI